MAVVYTHTRLDTGKVFYVGIGKNETRAFNTYHRSNWWKKITSKTKYQVNITHKDILWEEALVIEKYLISFYGREDLKQGTLCNMTDGGEGVLNPTVERREAISMCNKQRLADPNERAKISVAVKKAFERDSVKKANSLGQKRRFTDVKQRKTTSEKTKVAMARSEVREKILKINADLGMLTRTRKTMYKGILEKRVLPDDIDSFLADGWKFGRCPENKLGRYANRQVV